ncbi:MAG TPA: hypothetical protein VFS21_08700 [Roseiflexaceae bacterium]|nr:hypothetical protein [Roseiflexaceae bacterium]
MRTLFLRAFALIALLAGLAPAGSAMAQREALCFTETNYCISGAIRAYWERNGGLPVFGYPISAVRDETIENTWTGPTQWFQRDRLEDHSNEGKGVLAGRLGVSALEFQGINWQQALPDGEPRSGCRFFRETSYNLCGQFLRYWERNGGLERFGYPITRERPETLEGREYTVQYFERRRMELHPENAGTPYEVQLGLLGTLVVNGRPCIAWFFSPPPQPCAGEQARSTEGAVQRFERGVMFWTRNPDAFWIFHQSGRYWSIHAPYTFSDVPGPGEPPPGLYAPSSGFGDVWSGRIVMSSPWPLEQPLSELLGWATTPERGMTIWQQCQAALRYTVQRCYIGSNDGPLAFSSQAGGGIIR